MAESESATARVKASDTAPFVSKGAALPTTLPTFRAAPSRYAEWLKRPPGKSAVTCDPRFPTMRILRRRSPHFWAATFPAEIDASYERYPLDAGDDGRSCVVPEGRRRVVTALPAGT